MSRGGQRCPLRVGVPSVQRRIIRRFGDHPEPRAEAAREIAPHERCPGKVEHFLLVGLAHEPRTLREFGIELPGGPPCVAGECAHGVVLFCGEAFRFVERDVVPAFEDVRPRVPAERREDELIGADGPSIEHRHTRELAERLVPEQIADDAAGRPVENEPEAAVLLRMVGQNDHGVAEVRVRQTGVRDEKAPRESGSRVFGIAHSLMIRSGRPVSSACDFLSCMGQAASCRLRSRVAAGLTCRLWPMTFPSLNTKFLLCALPLAAAVALNGCERKTARVYDAPKDHPFVPPQEAAHSEDDGHDHQGKQAARAEEKVWRPALAWTLPGGWKDVGPDAANVGRFAAGEASVAITALTSMDGKETVLVNMWRQVRGQEPLEDTEAAKTLMEVPIAGTTGRMFEFADTKGEKPSRFVVAFTHRAEGSLFFKIQGPDAAVTAQKPAFFEFLKSVKFSEGAAPAPTPAAEAKGWPGEVPAGWTEVAPGPMQQAKFSVPEKDGAKADVMVSVFPSATGGTVENVKRWRKQIGLADIADEEIAKLAQPLAGAPEGSIIVDLKNEARALTGAIIPHGGRWWFLKLLGDAPAVASARDAFIVFATKVP